MSTASLLDTRRAANGNERRYGDMKSSICPECCCSASAVKSVVEVELEWEQDTVASACSAAVDRGLDGACGGVVRTKSRALSKHSAIH